MVISFQAIRSASRTIRTRLGKNVVESTALYAPLYRPANAQSGAWVCGPGGGAAASVPLPSPPVDAGTDAKLSRSAAATRGASRGEERRSG